MPEEAMPDESMREGAMPDEAVPDGVLPDGATTEYTCMDPTRLTLAEQWSQSNSLKVFLGVVLMRLLGGRFTPRFGISSAGPQFIAPTAVPAEAMNKLQAVLRQCVPLGCQASHWCTLDHIGPIESYSLIMLHESGRYFVGAYWTRVSFTMPPRENL